MRIKIALIAAVARNGVIGRGSEIPWRAKGEQKLFRDTTMGTSLIMGRKTFESIGKPLPGRVSIVISHTPVAEPHQENCFHVASLAEATRLAESLGKTCFIAGGGQIYQAALSSLTIDEIHLTTIDIDAEGDVYLPSIDLENYQLADEKYFQSNLNYCYRRYDLQL